MICVLIGVSMCVGEIVLVHRCGRVCVSVVACFHVLYV